MSYESQYRQKLAPRPQGLQHVEEAYIAPDEMESRIDFPAVLSTIRKEKRTIGLFTLVALLLSLAIAFLPPVHYTATASFIPPNAGITGASALASQLSQVSGLGAGLLGSAKSPGDLYVGILKSRLIQSALITKFNLLHVYGVRKQSVAEKMLTRASMFVVGLKDPIVTISVTDKSPQRASDMANAYLDALQATTGNLALTESSQRRLFYEQRLAQEKNALADAEVALKRTQEKTGLIAPVGQTAEEIQAIGQLRAQIAGREVNLAALLQSETEQNPDVIRLRREIASLEAQVSQMEKGRNGGPSGALSTAQVPGLELEYVRMSRDVKYHEALFEIIAKQYEAARLDEARDAPLQILDRATPPDSKSGPPRMYIVAGGLFLGMFAGFAWVVLGPSWRKLLAASAAAGPTAK